MKNNVLNQDVKTDKSEIEGLREQLAAVVAERDALAAENVELKQSELEFDKTCAEEFGPDWFSELTETPATDAAVAAIEARGVEKLADFCSTANNGHEIHPDIEEIRMFAAELREARHDD